MNAETVIDKPICDADRVFLLVRSGVTLLLFYLFVVGAICFVSLTIVMDLIILLILARFGLAGIFAITARQHVSLLGIFLKSLQIRQQAEFHVPLKQKDAPRLFSMIKDLCQRLVIAPPAVVCLQMDTNAWVRLDGYGRGAGTTILGIGYDELAGSSTIEIETILAHEMVHAKLVQRGVRRWLAVGLSRVAKLSMELAEHVDAHSRAKQSAQLATKLLRVFDRFGTLCASLGASYFRQDEFTADRGAANLCGVDAVRSALTRGMILDAKASRLPWRERVAQLQSGRSFSQWLVAELKIDESAPSPEQERAGFNKYSTHPSLRDRLAALPPSAPPLKTNQESAITLLSEPDAIAEKLMGEIQRVVAQQEKNDSRELQRWRKKVRHTGEVSPLQALAVVVAIIGLPAAVVIYTETTTIGLIVLFFVFATSFSLYHFGRYRERHVLPVPDFAVLKAGSTGTAVRNDGEGNLDTFEADFRGRMKSVTKRHERLALLVYQCYNALEKCEYQKANVAARLCLETNKNSVDGMLGYAITTAALQLPQETYNAINRLQRATGLIGRSTTWGVAWAFFLSGDWSRAEAFLDHARRTHPEEPTFLLLLAVCQSRRGKLQSAIISARTACTPIPKHKEHAKLLLDLLLQGGYLREAQRWLSTLATDGHQDAELIFTTARFHLLQRDFVAADKWANRLQQDFAGTHECVRLGELCEHARRDELAAALYHQSLDGHYFPEAFLGLARLAANQKNKEQAKGYLLAALDNQKTVGCGGATAWQLFRQTIAQLRDIQEPVPGCRAWIATFRGCVSPVALAHVSLLVYAQEQKKAEQYVNMITRAMEPRIPPLLADAVVWSDAPAAQQPPDHPTCPGVYEVIV